MMYETGKIIWSRMEKTNKSREMNYPYEELMEYGKPFALS